MNGLMHKFITVAFLFLTLSACESEENNSIEESVTEDTHTTEYRVDTLVTPSESSEVGAIVYTHEQYLLASGCRVDQELYERSLRQLLLSVVFKDEPIVNNKSLLEETQDDDYTRRHSRDFLGPIVKLSETDSQCAMEHLVTMAKQVGFPEDSATLEMDNVVEISVHASKLPKPYRLMNRAQYIDATSCLASKNTYEKYIAGFMKHVLSENNGSDSDDYMKQFLQEVGEGKFTENKSIDPACMTPTVNRIANELNLLNEKGEYELSL